MKDQTQTEGINGRHYSLIYFCNVPLNTHTDVQARIHKTDDQHLVVHAVDPVRPQQLDGLANEIRASAVEHPEAQVEVELVCGGLGVEALEGAEAALRPEEDKPRETD